MAKLLAPILALASVLGLSANMVSQAQQPQPPQSGNLPEELAIEQIKKTVVYLIGHYEANGGAKTAAGTAFFIFVPEPRLGENRGLVWLVTSKHVLRQPQLPDGSQGRYFRQMTVRYNLKVPRADGVQYAEQNVPVLDERGELQWLTDADETVDLALFRVAPNQATIDARWIGSDLITTPQMLHELRVNENDEVLFTGLFTSYLGTRKNYPIVRHGKVALIPEERIPTNRNNPNVTSELYLAEITSFGGNSGSPVFVRIGGLRETVGGPQLSGYRYLLLGVMQGFFVQAIPFTVEVKEVDGVVGQNSGIASVVPAHIISRILASPRARAIVDGIVAARPPAQ
jgi:hypothetical protein